MALFFILISCSIFLSLVNEILDTPKLLGSHFDSYKKLNISFPVKDSINNKT